MTSTLELPIDIYCEILSQVHASAPGTLLSTSLVSRELCKLSRRYLYHNINFDVFNVGKFDRCQYLFDLLKSNEDIQGFVREIAFTGVFNINDSADVKENLNSLLVDLESIIKGSPRMQLASFSWKVYSDPPSTLLELVDSRFPTGTISIEKYTGMPLPPLTTLSSLSAVVHIHRDPLHSFQPILLTSPSLRNLHIAAHQQSGCGRRRYSAPPYLQYDAARARRPADYPPLVSLRLDYFHFSALDDILVCMNWSNLRTLHLHEGDGRSLLEALTPASRTLPLLEALTFRKWYTVSNKEQLDRCHAILRGFLDSAAALRAVQLEGPFTRLCQFVAERHGPSLELLGFHCPEMTCHKTYLTVDDLMSLGRCQHLRELIMDVAPEFGLPVMEAGEDVQDYVRLSEMINSVDIFPALKRLTVWGELGPGKGSDAFSRVRERCAAIVDPRILSTAANKQEQTGKLESMTVCFGEHRIVRGRPSGWIMNEKDQASRSVLERVEGHQRITLKVQKEEPLRYRPNPSSPAPRRRWVVDHQGVWWDDEC